MSGWEQRVLAWLAGTATGSVVKVSLGAVLAYALDHVADWSVPAVVQAVVIVAVPVLINLVNPEDGRYGVVAEDLPER